MRLEKGLKESFFMACLQTSAQTKATSNNVYTSFTGHRLVPLTGLELTKSNSVLFCKLSEMAILRVFTAICANPVSVISCIFSQL